MIRLDILSDPICPWCLIGKTHLDRARREAGDPFTVAWHPFQLNPDMPRDGMDRRSYLEAKFGGRRKAAEVYARIDDAAREAGLEIEWGAIERTPNTLDAHRLIHWAGLEGRQDAVVDALFRTYFAEGGDIGDRSVLAGLAEGAGLDRALIARLLETDADAEDIRQRDRHARAKGVTGVPTFVVAEHHVVPGAQPVALWREVIEELRGAPEGIRPS